MKIRILLPLIIIPVMLFSQEKQASPDTALTGLNQRIDTLDFTNIDIRDFMRVIANRYDLNIFVDNSINQGVSLHFKNIRVGDVISYVVRENNLRMTQTGNIIKILPPEPPPIKPKEWDVKYQDGLLSVDFKNEPVEEAMHVIAERSGKTVLLERNATGTISGFLQKVPFEIGLRQLLANNGFLLEKSNNIFTVRRNDYFYQDASKGSKRGAGFYLNIQDSLISIDVNEVPLNQIIKETARRLDINVFIYGNIEGSISARATNLTFIDLLDLIFQGSDYTYKTQNDIILIGNKSVKGISTSEMIKVDYLKADKIPEILPNELSSKAEIKPIIEQNGIMVISTRTVINDIKQYIKQIDKPSPQILIETLVIDINNTKLREISANAGYGYTKSVGDSVSGYKHQIFPGIDLLMNSNTLNKLLDKAGNLLGISQIGMLPDDFFVKIKALEQDGILNVRSRPQISTLNGYPADIAIGTTQYYKLKSSTPYQHYPSQAQSYYLTETERFETVEANISLQIIPWVSGAGEITVEIHPEFKTPRERLSPEVPPTIDTRALNSTVRLKDGETIVLGGLVQNSTQETTSGIPFLSSLPLIGNIFETHNYNISKNELIIYVTPHLYYGDE